MAVEEVRLETVREDTATPVFDVLAVIVLEPVGGGNIGDSSMLLRLTAVPVLEPVGERSTLLLLLVV